jgi:RNA polymerase sigma factor
MPGDGQSIETLVAAAQSGDQTVREQVISEHLSFIKRTVRRLTHTMSIEHKDEYSIALSAFNEAIDRYQEEKNASFRQYASMVIKHRLWDWYRREAQHQKNESFESVSSDTGFSYEASIGDPAAQNVQETMEFEESGLWIQNQLQQLGLEFNTLVRRFPKHRDTRLLCIRLARCVNNHEELFNRLMKTGQVPGKALSNLCQVPVKTIERNRQAVILLSLLMCSDLSSVHNYIERYEREDTHV